jgi:hypothetical protein
VTEVCDVAGHEHLAVGGHGDRENWHIFGRQTRAVPASIARVPT